MNEFDSVDPSPPTQQTPGQRLKERREEWGLSVEEVASSLNLGVGVIIALESDDHSKLPGSTFIKGYIRSCAKLLDLNPEELIGALDPKPETVSIQIPGAKTRASGFHRRDFPRPRSRHVGQSIFRWVVIILLLGLIVAGGISQLPRFGIQGLSDLVPSLWMGPSRPSELDPAISSTDEGVRPALKFQPPDRPGSGDDGKSTQGDIIRFE